MNFLGGLIYAGSASWHSLTAYYFCTKPQAFIRTYTSPDSPAQDENSQILASEILSWVGGLHATLALAGWYSSFNILFKSNMNIQTPLLLGAASLSQLVLVRRTENWRDELDWFTIINSSLTIFNAFMVFYIYKHSSSNILVDAINGLQKMLK